MSGRWKSESFVFIDQVTSMLEKAFAVMCCLGVNHLPVGGFGNTLVGLLVIFRSCVHTVAFFFLFFLNEKRSRGNGL